MGKEVTFDYSKTAGFISAEEIQNMKASVLCAKDVLLSALKKYEGALLLVSHEKQFAEAVCDDVFTCKESV